MDPSHLAALYNAAPIILWVEDLLTSQYLDEVWEHDRRIKTYVGGGHETLAAVVEDACRAGRKCVFNLRDRDFGPTNRPRWKEAEVYTFALESFEIECLLLDAAALSKCDVNTAPRTETEIRDRLTNQAKASLWWMACRRVIAELRESRQQYFPAHPKRRAVTAQPEAETVLFENDWVKKTVPGLPALVTQACLRQRLLDAYKQYETHLNAGTWIPQFSGKEFIEDALSWIYTKGRPPGSAGLQDLAKAVARQQLKEKLVPIELMELKSVLLSRLKP